MKKKVLKNKFKRKKFKMSALKKIVFKFLSLKLSLTSKKNLRFFAVFFNKTYSSSNKGLCILSNRGHGVGRRYKLSRIILRDFLTSGIIPGYYKL